MFKWATWYHFLLVCSLLCVFQVSEVLSTICCLFVLYVYYYRVVCFYQSVFSGLIVLRSNLRVICRILCDWSIRSNSSVTLSSVYDWRFLRHLSFPNGFYFYLSVARHGTMEGDGLYQLKTRWSNSGYVWQVACQLGPTTTITRRRRFPEVPREVRRHAEDRFPSRRQCTKFLPARPLLISL